MDSSAHQSVDSSVQQSAHPSVGASAQPTVGASAHPSVGSHPRLTADTATRLHTSRKAPKGQQHLDVGVNPRSTTDVNPRSTTDVSPRTSTYIQWLGNIPDGWEVERNKRFLTECKEIVGVNSDKYQLLSLTIQGVIVRDLENKKGKMPKDFFKYKVVEKGDIIFCLFDIDETPRTVGIAENDGMITGAYDIFKIKDVDPKFFYYYYLDVDNHKRLKPFYTGLRKTVKIETFLSLPFPLPPLSVQHRISSYLDEKTELINRLIETRTAQIDKLKQYRAAVVSSAVTKGLNPNRKMKNSNIQWIGDIPEEWEVVKMKNAFEPRSQKGFPDEPILCATQSQGVIPQSMYENRVVVVNKGFENLKLVKIGDFVISLRSFQGGIEYAYYQGIISAAYTILTPNNKNNSEYYKYLFKSKVFISLLQTCVIGIREGQNINYSMLREKCIPIPPLSEQHSIVSYLDKKVSEINNLIKTYDDEIEKMKNYKNSLVSAVVTGQIAV